MACWTAVVYILHGADWNTHDPEVPVADEEPPPANGIPHSMFGDGLTAEQLYQHRIGFFKMVWAMTRHHIMLLGGVDLRMLNGILGLSSMHLRCLLLR